MNDPSDSPDLSPVDSPAGSTADAGAEDATVSTGPAPALPADQRPVDPTPVHTDDLPPTPIRDRNIPGSAWIEAPGPVLHAGDGLAPPGDPAADPPEAMYKRRIGPWLLWRAGPARGADARYVAVAAADLSRTYEFRLLPDGSGEGAGPSGTVHTRFRAWKEDLRDATPTGTS